MFHLSKSQTHRILQNELTATANRLHDYISINNIENESHPAWPNTIGIIDATEIEIQCWIPQSFSGKAMKYTLKYQVTIGIFSHRTLNIYGPFMGSIHDSTIYNQSNLSTYKTTIKLR